MGGVHYSERRYYDNDEENERFINIYGSQLYCKHNHPNYLKCHRCEAEKNDEIMSRWYRNQELKFQQFINSIHGFMFIAPDPQKINKIKVRENDKFKGLKKSNSQEELKKEYHKLAKKYHPDKEGGNTKLFQKLSQLYNILTEKFI
tara:strand:- start:844 stop:1281 length:438 start_codon:yes stop_codon:yes gene_type:complete